MTQWLLHSRDSQTITLYATIAITLVVVTYWGWQGAPWQDPDQQGWLAIIILAVVSTYLARLLLYAGVQRLSSAQMTLLMPLETLFSILWSVLFLKNNSLSSNG